MTTTPRDVDDLDDLLDDLPVHSGSPKPGAKPLVRSPKARAAVAAQAARDAKLAERREIDAQAAKLAQIANLLIAGHTYASIGAEIGATAEEVERLMSAEAARYVRNQPSLRVFVRNFLSAKYTDLLDAVWDTAVDKGHDDQIENHTAAVRVLERMGRLHGAEAPVQKEIKVEHSPEAVEAIVQALATQSGMGYDMDIFNTVPGEVIHAAPAQAHAALEVSRNQVAESDGHDEF